MNNDKSKSMATVTIIETAGGFLVTSDGCGRAGEYASAVVELIRTVQVPIANAVEAEIQK
jgi:hypothetical protein